ncbi:uncharacterized protein LOC135137671 [Zophobas morio]|uniref:uncharacterized protein LOC135137671 n=1 Tax=Zophobas morio TaxID=2755281 RepID=UPI0030831567
MKCFIGTLVVFLLAESVFSLSCYTDDGTIPLSVVRRPVYYEECNSYLAKVGKKYNLDNSGLDFDLRCFKMVVTTNRRATDFMVKGCVPEGMCDIVVAALIEKELEKNSTISVQNMKCAECKTNGCNIY